MTEDKIGNIHDLNDRHSSTDNTIRFDTDSVPIKIDNCCTQTMSGYISDFIPSTLKEVNDRYVNGFGNR